MGENKILKILPFFTSESDTTSHTRLPDKTLHIHTDIKRPQSFMKLAALVFELTQTTTDKLPQHKHASQSD